jgi:hypothetical protein
MDAAQAVIVEVPGRVVVLMPPMQTCRLGDISKNGFSSRERERGREGERGRE